MYKFIQIGPKSNIIMLKMVWIYLVPVQEVILRLFNNRSNQIQPISNSPSFSNLLTRPLTSPPIKSPTLINNKIHCSYSLLNRSTNIRPMTIHNINILHPQSLQRRFRTFHNMLPWQPLIIRSLSSPEDLCRNNDIRPFPVQLFDCLSHDLLCATVGVDFCVVEEVYAVVAAALEKRFCFFNVELVSETYPCSVGELADF